MNEQLNLFDNRSKVDKTLDRIKFAYEVAQNQGLGALYVAFSGGKDSVLLAEMCRLAKEKFGVEYELHYNITGIDPPEIVYFMRENYLDLIWHQHEKSMFQLIVEKGFPPTRIIRYCCAELKEHGGQGKMCLTGVRWAESTKRAKRKPFETMEKSRKQAMLFNDNSEERKNFEQCQLKNKLVVNPIIDWSDEEVWEYIKSNKIPYCKLYDEGFKRIGCIGCPMNNSDKEFKRYPKFRDYYINAFDKMLKNYKHKDTSTWKNGEDVFNWWIKGKGLEDKNQISIFDEEEL